MSRRRIDPIGNARVAKRLAAFATHTTLHLSRVPEDVDQHTMNQMANVWAGVLIESMGMSLNVEGLPDEGGALLVANHRSYTDIIALLASTPCCFLAKDDVAKWPILGRAAVRAGTVFVNRSTVESRKAARDIMKGLLEDGHKVVVFPEGTTYPGPGCQAFRVGSFETALDAGVPVIPIAIEYPNPRDAWGDESFVTHFSQSFRQDRLRVHLHYGPGLIHDDPNQLMSSAHDWIGSTLHKLWVELQDPVKAVQGR